MNYIKRFFMNGTKTAGRVTHGIYILLRAIVTIMLVDQLIQQNMGNTFLLLLTLVLFEIPYLLEKILKIQIPNMLEIILISFIFSSTVLGELSDFYGYFSMWDTFLHALSGFLAGGVGFSLVYLLNKNTKTMNLTPLLLAIVSFCFSMTVGVAWEFVEFSADHLFQLDMQKDTLVQQINSVELSKDGNTVHTIPNIEKTEVGYKTDDGKSETYTISGGYLDIGIMDTMKDLFVNFIGALTFSIFGYLYSRNDYRKFTFIRNFIPRKAK
ncbi:hypothetical protein JQC73_12365 [Enterococcus durans]|uniref:hypothetical protein n=1 Tax=Enterococcus durans TaxID=53345 RepID=UPI00193C34E2|nr:hypothetical protein [Enterococcus durans]MBM1153695.1 hypothetical protein [Enterococcus durans]